MRRRIEIVDDEKYFDKPTSVDHAEDKDTIINLDHNFEKKLESMRVSDPFINATIDGRYLLHERIGEGGMGAVYRATHILMNKAVAIKLISAELAHLPQVVGRFEREARSASRLSHPNCITVTDFGRTEDGTLFLVMELLDGESLNDLLCREETISASRAIEITKQILEGLSHAHEAGIVHRDLKPSNVMLVSQNDLSDFAKVFDFGIAKIAEDSGADHKLTQQGMIVGTPAYLSPEQALGDEADNRSDLYAVGVMLFEMLMGDVPYKGTIAMDVVKAHINAEIPELNPRRPFPAGLRKIITQAMAKNPSERFQSAGEFLIALNSVDFSKMEYGKSKSNKMQTALRCFFLLTLGAVLVLGAMVARDELTAKQIADLKSLGTIEISKNTKESELNLVVEEEQLAELLSKVEEQIKLGIPHEAAITAKKALALNPDEPAVHLLLGHALFLSNKKPEAVSEYEQALKAKPDLIADKRLWTHLEDALKAEASAEKAASILAGPGGEKGITLLRERANSPLADRAERSAARRALIAVERVEAVDWIATLTADFNDFKACKKRRQIIVQMEQTADPRFLPLLEAQKPWNKANNCIRTDVERAIKTLKKIAEEQQLTADKNTGANL